MPPISRDIMLRVLQENGYFPDGTEESNNHLNRIRRGNNGGNRGGSFWYCAEHTDTPTNAIILWRYRLGDILRHLGRDFGNWVRGTYSIADAVQRVGITYDVLAEREIYIYKYAMRGDRPFEAVDLSTFHVHTEYNFLSNGFNADEYAAFRRCRLSFDHITPQETSAITSLLFPELGGSDVVGDIIEGILGIRRSA